MSVREEQVNSAAPMTCGVAGDGAEARAEQTYRRLRADGLTDTDIMAFAGDLLSLVASEFRNKQPAD